MEILHCRPWVDDDSDSIFFRLKDFDAFLRKNKFTEFKSHKIAQRLRDINGESVLLKIKGKPVRVWQLPVTELDHLDTTLDGATFNVSEAPF